MDSALCMYNFFVWSSLNSLQNSQQITFPTQLCLVLLVLYSFGANLLHSFILWWIVLSLSLHYLHFLFCWVLSIFALALLVFMALFHAVIRRDLVSFLRFPFLSSVQIFSCEISFVYQLKCPYNCFSSHFCFLVIVVLLILLLFLVSVISFSLLFFI